LHFTTDTLRPQYIKPIALSLSSSCHPAIFLSVKLLPRLTERLVVPLPGYTSHTIQQPTLQLGFGYTLS
jgi:hypothetical protein